MCISGAVPTVTLPNAPPTVQKTGTTHGICRRRRKIATIRKYTATAPAAHAVQYAGSATPIAMPLAIAATPQATANIGAPETYVSRLMREIQVDGAKMHMGHIAIKRLKNVAASHEWYLETAETASETTNTHSIAAPFSGLERDWAHR